MATETLELILNAQDNATASLDMVGQRLGAVADEADDAMGSIEGLNADIRQDGRGYARAGEQGTAAVVPLGGAFAALGPKILAVAGALTITGVGISTLSKLSTGLFELWRGSEETLDRFRLSLADAGVGAEAVDEKLRTLRDTVRYSTLTAFREAEPRIANLFARLDPVAQARVDELADLFADLGVFADGQAISASVTLELGLPEVSELEAIAQGIGLVEGALALDDIFNASDLGRVDALIAYIEGNVVPSLSEWKQATLELDDAWDDFLRVLGNPLDGLFTPLVVAATTAFKYLTDNWTVVWEAIKAVAVSGLIVVGDTLTGGLVSFGLRVYDWVTSLVELAPLFYQTATAWAQELWAGFTEWIEQAAQGVGGFFGDLFSGDLFSSSNRGAENYGPAQASRYAQPPDINIRLELDGEQLARVNLRGLDNEFQRRAF